MQVTKHYCDVCDREVENLDMFLVKMAIHKREDTYVICSLDVCKECVKETGFDPGRGNSYINEKTTESGFRTWFKWFKKARR